MAKQLLKGNEAFAEAAVRYGLEAYFGYPITPQSEALEYLSKRMVELGRVFVQAESELGAINMVYGAACAGVRTMTSTSGPGFSLMEEGISYIAGSDVPAVIVNVQRGGPGLGNIQPSQSDYFLMTKSAGHGDFHPVVLAPSGVQEFIDMVGLAFDIADRYRTVVMIAADGSIGQMMESAELPPMQPLRKPEERPAWALTGAQGRPAHFITSLDLSPEGLEKWNLYLQDKLARIAQNETRWKEYATEDAELLLVAYGTVGRICLSVVREARKEGLRVGLLRPQTLWPFPAARLAELSQQVRGILVSEMNAGQMLEDVKLAVLGHTPVKFYGRLGGMIPMVDEIYDALKALDAETRKA